MGFNVDVKPLIKVWVRKEFLHNFKEGHGEFEEGYIFGACAMKSRPLLFHVHLKSGAKFIRLPINAFCTKQDAPVEAIGDLELWDCLGTDVQCHQYDYFKNYEVMVRLGKETHFGRYLMTFDFTPSGGFEETPDQHKDFNLIELDNGNLALQPNNAILWIDEHFTGQPKGIPNYKAMETYWLVEREEFKDFGDNDSFFYTIKKGEK